MITPTTMTISESAAVAAAPTASMPAAITSTVVVPSLPVSFAAALDPAVPPRFARNSSDTTVGVNEYGGASRRNGR